MDSAQPEEVSFRRRAIAVVVVGGIAVLALYFFIETRDPMILLFGMVASALVGLFLHLSSRSPASPSGWGSPPVPLVKIRCATCRALNPEEARFCNQCGKGV